MLRSAIAHDVPEGALGIERSEQRSVEGWSERRKREKDAADQDKEAGDR